LRFMNRDFELVKEYILLKGEIVMAEQTLYEKAGGGESIEKVVDYFYEELVLKDPTVNQFFEHTDMIKQKRHQSKFISYALGGPNQYSGNSMAKAHEGMNLQPEHFNAIAKHLHDALAHFGVSERDIDEALTRVAALRDDILYK
jgi:hemoglobin